MKKSLKLSKGANFRKPIATCNLYKRKDSFGQF